MRKIAVEMELPIFDKTFTQLGS